MSNLPRINNVNDVLSTSDDEPQRCEWFALCENAATTTRSHPILGPVPICERCDARVDAL